MPKVITSFEVKVYAHWKKTSIVMLAKEEEANIKTIYVGHELENKNRLGLSFGHISNVNLGDKNPGVEIISLSYQVPF